MLYHGKQAWTSPKSIAELFDDFDLYVNLSLRNKFLIDLSQIEIDKLKIQEAAAGPQLVMKGEIDGSYCEMLKYIYPLLKKYKQLNDNNISYMTTYDSHGGEVFLEKFSKFDSETANNYKSMFEAAIQKEATRSLRKGRQLGRQEGIKIGEEKGIKIGEEKGIKIGREGTLAELVAKGIITQKEADDLLKKNK